MLAHATLFLVLFASALSPLAAQAGRPVDAFDALVEAERSFARAACEHGIRAAFLEYLAEGSTLFAPLPTDGRALYEARPETAALLAWRPAVAEIAASADYGWTSGPWSFHPEGQGSPAVAHGHFVSVWRKQPDGGWRVELDVGVDHEPAPGGDSLAVERAGPGRVPEAPPDLAVLRGEIQAADAALGSALEAVEAVAWARSGAAEDVRVYRAGSLPARGRAAWTNAVAADARPTRAETGGAGLAGSGELGYTYGVLRSAGDGGPDPSASYVRFWRRTDAGWRLALDLIQPAPPEPPAAGG